MSNPTHPDGRPPVLVTGGAGYVGAHLCKALARNGFLPVVYDDYSSGRPEQVRYCPAIEGSVLDQERLQSVLEQFRPRCVMHLAACTLVEESLAQAQRYDQVNHLATRLLLECMARTGVHQLVFSSTAAVYGEPVETQISEAHQLSPGNPYGASKLAAEQAIWEACNDGWLNASVLRYFNAAGCDAHLEVGDVRCTHSHLFPCAAQAIVDGKVFRAYGQDYPTPDGSAIRDYVHVDDIARAHVQLCLKPPADPWTVLNLGSGRGISVLEAVRVIEACYPGEFHWQWAERRAGDCARLVCDNRRARELLDWMPVESNPEQMIRSTVAWLRSRASR